MQGLEELSTASIAASERLPFWNAVAARMVAPIQIEALTPQDFQAHIFRRRFREIEMIAISSSPARIRELAGGARADVLNLQLQLSGRTVNHTGGRNCTLEAGDFTLYDPTLPLAQSFTEPTQVIVLRLPIATAESRLPRLRRMAGIRMQGRAGAGALFATFLRQVWRQLQTEEGEWAETLDAAIWPLLDMAYAGERQGAADDDRRETRRRALFAAIEAQLCDPELDSQRIARAIGVSTRYVQMLFAEIATTPSAFIQGRRLEFAAERLEREGAAASITTVAFDVGFNDLSSFCRAFRRRFGVSPSDYRAGTRRPLNS